MTVPADAASVVTGPILLALPVALAAGVVSFFSPCVLPLVPVYLSYVTGMTGAELQSAGRSGAVRLSKVAWGTLLFIAGFTAVFVSYGLAFGGLGAQLQRWARPLDIVLGCLTVLLGLAFLGAIPALQRQWRAPMNAKAGVASAPLLGVVFAIGWTPCIGPTLAAVQALSLTSASALRGALLSAVYCVGLGVPFLVAGLAYGRAMVAFGWVREHSSWVTRVGGAMLVVLGVLLITGLWRSASQSLVGWVSSFAPVV